jgi:hypothetical protein
MNTYTIVKNRLERCVRGLLAMLFTVYVCTFAGPCDTPLTALASLRADVHPLWRRTNDMDGECQKDPRLCCQSFGEPRIWCSRICTSNAMLFCLSLVPATLSLAVSANFICLSIPVVSCPCPGATSAISWKVPTLDLPVTCFSITGKQLPSNQDIDF